MSRHSSHDRVVTIANSAEIFEVIREGRISPTTSSVNINAPSSPEPEEGREETRPVIICPCKAIRDEEKEKENAAEIEKLLKEKETEMESKFRDRINNEMQYLKERFEFILQNEQVRASYMLREAHRERQEKISALQNQLECKNLAGLMYVLCSERRKSKIQIQKLTEEYTNYIQAIQQILTESQKLILHLSRGYKTAARVDNEWREKMKKVIKHFQNFITNFIGGTPESNQYLFDLPNLVKIKNPVKDNPSEDPCEPEDEAVVENEIEPEKTWWETLEGDDRPFVMFGDMADFKPPQRRQVLKVVKAAKTAPRKWKEYDIHSPRIGEYVKGTSYIRNLITVFHEMFLKTDCPNAELIKDQYMNRVPPTEKWECRAQTDKQTSSRGSETSRRVTTASVDIRGNMGSILKIITSAGVPQGPPKATLLGARDSMEIASTTRLREKHRHTVEHGKVVLNIGNKIDSMFNEMYEVMEEAEEEDESGSGPKRTTSKIEEDVADESFSALGSIHNDSLQVIASHVPDHDHKINYEKICPMEKCQKMQVDSFIRSLPAYMRASPFTHFEQTYDEYEACSPEQLEILKRRIDEKKKKERVTIDVLDDNPLVSWTASLAGVAMQTSRDEISLPPCTCREQILTSPSSTQRVYNIADLIPVRQELETINAELFFNDDIEFNRFKVIGQDTSGTNMKYENDKDFSKNRLQEIKKILKQHPSLCELFQANMRC